MKKYYPIIISLLLLISAVFLWDQLTLPYNENNKIVGEYFNKKFNPLNEIIRFTFFIILPSLAYLIVYLKVDKSILSFKKNSLNYFLNNKKNKKEFNNLNFWTFLFVVLIFFEFLAVDLSRFQAIDTFHDTVYLTPPFNYLTYKSFFNSTLYDYGFAGNNLGLFFNFIFGFYSLGAINFLKLILVFLVKLSLIFISKKLVEYVKFDLLIKQLFFIIFTFIILSLPDYYDQTSYYSPRTSLYLLFIILLGSALCDPKFKEIKFFIIGSFSLLSLFWWFDIGFYINLLLFLLVIFLLIHLKWRSLFFLLFGALFAWTNFFLIFPSEEINSFFENIKFIFLTTDYLIGLEYLKPFSEGSIRWTRALLIIYLSCIILINFNFSKKINIDYKAKIFLNTIFLSGVVMFKSALTRSDVSHIKYSSGLYTTVFIFLILYLIIDNLIKNNEFNKFLNKMTSKNKKKILIFLPIFLSILYLSGIINDKNSSTFQNKVNNLINFNQNLSILIKTDDLEYLKGNKLLAYKRYKELSKNDDCLQFFSDDNYFPFFIKKPTCTRYYLSNQIINNFSEDEFIAAFKQKLPNIILYRSPSNLLLNRRNLSGTINFINENYIFHEDYNGYIFYKKKSF